MLYANNNKKHFFKNYKYSKILYYSPYLWRLMFLINSNNIYNNLTKKIFNNSSIIPNMFIGYEVFLYSGLKWLRRFINKWVVGNKIGSLSWNRKRSLFKNKQLKK